MHASLTATTLTLWPQTVGLPLLAYGVSLAGALDRHRNGFADERPPSLATTAGETRRLTCHRRISVDGRRCLGDHKRRSSRHRFVEGQEPFRFGGIVGAEVLCPPVTDGLESQLGLDRQGLLKVRQGHTYRTRSPPAPKSASATAPPWMATSADAVSLLKPCGSSRLSLAYRTPRSSPVVGAPWPSTITDS